MNEYGLERVFGVPQLFLKLIESTVISLIVSKVTKEVLVSEK